MLFKINVSILLEKNQIGQFSEVLSAQYIFRGVFRVCSETSQVSNMELLPKLVNS